jgi:peptidoglycan/LPS O-acetylase OafA/YrhL
MLSKYEKLIQWLLRALGLVMLSAIVPVFFPSQWLGQMHDHLLGQPFPDQSISWYFARSLSLMYFAHGVIVFALSTDVRRYWPLIRILGLLNVVLGLILCGIDFASGMPWWWTAFEGPSVILGGCLLSVLIKVCDAQSKSTSPLPNSSAGV